MGAHTLLESRLYINKNFHLLAAKDYETFLWHESAWIAGRARPNQQFFSLYSRVYHILPYDHINIELPL
jgi:hypothetical protein